MQEDGIQLVVKGTHTTVYGSIATVCADNLGSCALGGFKEGGTAYRFCRQCMVTNGENKTIVSYDLKAKTINLVSIK